LLSLGTGTRLRHVAAAVTTAVVSMLLLAAPFAAGRQAVPVSPTHDARPAVRGRGSDTLDPRIAVLARRHPHARIEAIVQFSASVGPARARREVAAVHGRVVAQLHIIPALAVRATAAQARRLAAEPDVESVSLNARVHNTGSVDATVDPRVYGDQLGNTFTASLDAPALWRAGGTGAGVGVAVIDTGINGTLPDFASTPGGPSRVIASAVTNPQAQTDNDTYGHGTDVAGIIAGDSANRTLSDPLRDQFVGVAPNANLVSIKVADEQGDTNVLDVIYGLQFAVDFQHRYGIRVVNMSLNEDTAQSYLKDPLDAAVESAWMHGLVVVVAAGNRGTAPDAVDYAPANDPYVITVGGVDENGSADVSDHSIASWSSRGITQDGFPKPDVYAPGAHIVSELAPGSAFSTMCPACVVDGQYIRASGTSFAAPMIAGVVADVLQLHPLWTPDQVKAALTDPSVRTSADPEIDALKVAELASPSPANQGLPRNPLITDWSGGVDYTKASWGEASWGKASWGQASWSLAGSDSAGFAKASWSTMSWDALRG
jgi:serine protease AprX